MLSFIATVTLKIYSGLGELPCYTRPMIQNVILMALVRAAMRAGYVPQKMLIARALRALNKDDLDGALESFLVAAKRDAGNEKLQVLREILVSEIKFRRKALKQRIANIERRRPSRLTDEPMAIDRPLMHFDENSIAPPDEDVLPYEVPKPPWYKREIHLPWMSKKNDDADPESTPKPVDEIEACRKAVAILDRFMDEIEASVNNS